MLHYLSSGLSVKNTSDLAQILSENYLNALEKDKQALITGFGLAIAEQICNINNFTTGYVYPSGTTNSALYIRHQLTSNSPQSVL